MPRLLRDILDESMRSEPDMDVVGCGGDAELAVALDRDELDFVILAEPENAGLPTAWKLLSTHPALKVITIPADGRFAHLFELHRHSLTEPSPRMLIETVRAALSARRGH
jgi:DNA-binding NarL/FixJ family response regulator